MSTDPEGFREFVDARSQGLIRTAWLLTGDSVSAEDLLQTALAKTWPHWGRVSQGNPEAYVRKVMVRTNLTWRARFWNREQPTSTPEVAAPAIRSSAPDETGSVGDQMVVAAALWTLPIRQRQVVVLRYFDDLSVEETANIMSVSAGTVKSQSAKALDKLRVSLSDERPREQRSQP